MKRISCSETEAAVVTHIEAQGGSASEVEFLFGAAGHDGAALVALRTLATKGALVRNMIGA
jgi:hypothetical protein